MTVQHVFRAKLKEGIGITTGTLAFYEDRVDFILDIRGGPILSGLPGTPPEEIPSDYVLSTETSKLPLVVYKRVPVTPGTRVHLTRLVARVPLGAG